MPWPLNSLVFSSSAFEFLAVFHGIVSVHFQIPIYLFYTVGLSLTGLIWMLAGKSMGRRAIVAACALWVSAVALNYHSAQHLSRGLIGTLKAERTEVTRTDGLDRLGLSVEAKDIKLYRRIADLVNREVRGDQTILALPVNPEIYFLTGRRVPVRFFNSALGIVGNTDFRAVMKTIRDRPPRLGFHQPSDKYNTKFGDEIMVYAWTNYELAGNLGELKIYRFRN